MATPGPRLDKGGLQSLAAETAPSKILTFSAMHLGSEWVSGLGIFPSLCSSWGLGVSGLRILNIASYIHFGRAAILDTGF